MPKDIYWFIHRGVRVLFVPRRGKPWKKDSPFYSFHTSRVLYWPGQGLDHLKDDREVQIARTQKYVGFRCNHIMGHEDDLSMWVSIKKISKEVNG